MYIQKYNTYIIYIYIFRQLNVFILITPTYPMTICKIVPYPITICKIIIKFCRLKATRARTRPVGTLSAISINFTKG